MAWLIASCKAVGVERTEMTQKLRKLEKGPCGGGGRLLLILHDMITSHSCPLLGVFAPKLVFTLAIWNLADFFRRTVFHAGACQRHGINVKLRECETCRPGADLRSLLRIPACPTAAPFPPARPSCTVTTCARRGQGGAPSLRRWPRPAGWGARVSGRVRCRHEMPGEVAEFGQDMEDAAQTWGLGGGGGRGAPGAAVSPPPGTGSASRGGGTVCAPALGCSPSRAPHPGSRFLLPDTGSPGSHQVFRHSVEHGPLDPDGVQLCEDGRQRGGLRHHCRGDTGHGLLRGRGACPQPEPGRSCLGYVLFAEGLYVQGCRAKGPSGHRGRPGRAVG